MDDSQACAQGLALMTIARDSSSTSRMLMATGGGRASTTSSSTTGASLSTSSTSSSSSRPSAGMETEFNETEQALQAVFEAEQNEREVQFQSGARVRLFAFQTQEEYLRAQHYLNQKKWLDNFNSQRAARTMQFRQQQSTTSSSSAPAAGPWQPRPLG